MKKTGNRGEERRKGIKRQKRKERRKKGRGDSCELEQSSVEEKSTPEQTCSMPTSLELK